MSEIVGFPSLKSVDVLKEGTTTVYRLFQCEFKPVTETTKKNLIKYFNASRLKYSSQSNFDLQIFLTALRAELLLKYSALLMSLEVEVIWQEISLASQHFENL